MGRDSNKSELDLEFCYLDETIPPCRECEKHFFHQQQTFNWLEAAVVLISILTLVTDLVTDTLVTCQYFAYGEYAWGLLTLSFTLLPSFIVQFFSLRWYQMDEDLSRRKWIAHGFQLGPLYRYIVVLQTGMAAKKSGDPLDFDLLYHQQSDVCMLRLFESFMESAPQVVLQLYIMVATNEENFFTGISATVSLVSLCWAIAVYSRIHRRVREDKKVVSWPGVLLQAVWRIGMISSRVIALVLFATAFKAYVFVVIAVHWFVMAVWVYLQDTDFCRSWLEERLFNAVIAEVYIFCFFNLKEGTSRYRVFVFYSVIFVENVFCLVLWNSSAVEKGFYTEVGFSIVFGGFFVGVTSMILYYRYLHPHSSVVCCKADDKSKHQPCLRHEDVLNVSKWKGLEAEISPRSLTPSPCLQAIDQHSTPLALPMSEFTTPASRPLSPGSKLLLSTTYQDEVSQTTGKERQLKGLHRARSEGYLFQEDDVSLGVMGASIAKSVNSLSLAKTSIADSTSLWMDQFARERKSLTQDFFKFLSPDDPVGDDHVNRVDIRNASAGVADSREPAASREKDQKPQSLLRVDSVSKRLLKGNADRKMHRSFRRQLRFEDKGESGGQGPATPESGSSANRTGKSVVKKPAVTNPMEMMKLPIDNVKAKLKVFEALSSSKTDLNNSSPLSGKLTKGAENTVKAENTSRTENTAEAENAARAENTAEAENAAGNKMSLTEDTTRIHSLKQSSEAGLCQNKIRPAGSTLGLQSNGCSLGEGSHDGSVSNSNHALTQLGLNKSGLKDENPDQLLGIDDNSVGNYQSNHTTNNPAERHAPDLKQSDQLKFAEVKCESEKLFHTQRSPCMDKDMQNSTEAIQEPIHPVQGNNTKDLHLVEKIPVGERITGGSKGEVETQEVTGCNFEQKNVNKHSLEQSVSPLNEIQIVRQPSPSQYSKSSGGKENKIGRTRKSFGNVKIEDIKESITNTPKKDVKRSRRSFSRIPTDIVAMRVWKLTSTPENP